MEILYKCSLFTEFQRYSTGTTIVNFKNKDRSPVQVFMWRAPLHRGVRLMSEEACASMVRHVAQSHQSAAIKPLNPHFQILTLFFFIFFQFSAPKNSLKLQKCLKEA